MSIEAKSIQETTNKENLLLLITLRWLAVVGQVTTIAVTSLWFRIPLPVFPMACVISYLVAVNIVSFYRYHSDKVITNGELFAELLMDVAALTVQIYLTGGVTNPFILLFLLQTVLGAVLLRPLLSWILVAAATGCFVTLVVHYREIGLLNDPMGRGHGGPNVLDLHRWGTLVCFLLASVLLVLFVSRINQNLRLRDARISELRQQSAEEEHIVRMGLLASGAAHELGTPLSTLSVILNDWRRMPTLRASAEIGAELDEMQGALDRCKEIVSRILLAAGETRAEGAERTTLVNFFDDIVQEWRQTRTPTRLDYLNRIRADTAIASDAIITQILHNLFDNALEASPTWVGIELANRGEELVVTVHDRGPGFAPDILARFGKPYQSTKNRPGSGLGLFLVVNVLRKLGGSVAPRNNADGGATVEVRLPIAALAIGGLDAVD